MGDVKALLAHAGLRAGSTLTQTQAEQTLSLQDHRRELHELDHTKEPNPHGRFADVLIYKAEDVAALALQVQGPGLEAARAAISAGRAQAQREKWVHEQMAEERDEWRAKRAKQAAASDKARTPAERLCVHLKVVRDDELNKTQSMAKFNLLWWQIQPLNFREQPITTGPRARFKKPAHMYKAVEVAERALELGTMRAPPEEAPRPAARPQRRSRRRRQRKCRRGGEESDAYGIRERLLWGTTMLLSGCDMREA